MADIDIQYDPNDKQIKFHECSADEVVYGGAKGGGKSCALVMESLAYGLENSGANMYIFRETYDDLEANIIREWKEKVPKELYEYNESKHIANLINGTRMHFRYIRNYQDAEGYQGRSMDWIGVDELTKHEKRSIQVLLSCLRSPKGFKPTFRGTCNPGGKGHVWVKEDYILATNYGEKVVIDPVTGNKRAFIPATVYDNKVLMDNDPNYVKRLENLPENEKRAFLYGDWDIFEGQVFGEWKQNKNGKPYHVIKPFKIPDYWKRFCSLDWGYNDPCCVLWHAVDSENRVYTYRELYINQTMASDVAKKMKQLSVGEGIAYTVASPDMWQKRGNDVMGGESIAETFMNNGVMVIKADTDRLNGWQRVHEYLAEAPDGLPYVQVFENCYNLIKCLPQLIYDEKKVEDVAEEPHDITHAPEAFRYGLMSRPSPNFIEKVVIDILPEALRTDEEEASWYL